MKTVSTILIMSVLLMYFRNGYGTSQPHHYRPWTQSWWIQKPIPMMSSYQVCDFLPNNCSLRGAISKSNAISGGIGTIVLPAGTYRLTVEGASEDENVTGDLDITEPVKIIGDGSDTTFIQAGTRPSDGIDRVIQVFSTGGHVELKGLTVRWGKAPEGEHGGGIHIIYNSDTLIDQLSIEANSGYQGGGIYVHTSGDFSLTYSTIINNVAENSGGGIYHMGILLMEGTTISGNSAAAGGGICNNSEAYLRNVTISGNTATSIAGGIFQINTGDLTIYNVTIANNIAPAGTYWQMFNTLTVNAYNSIISSASGSIACSNVLDVDVHNIYSDTSCGTNTPVPDPMLGALQDNGGLTWTHALLIGSPAIDWGDNRTCYIVDQRGVWRRYDGDKNGTLVCDIGAYEYNQGLTLLRGFVPLIKKP